MTMIDSDDILQEITQRWPQVSRVYIAYSGGLDSSVLLHKISQALVASSSSLRCTAIHINHQISVNADTWQRHCERQARALGVDFCAHKVNVLSQGRGIEDEARRQRYHLFEQTLTSGDVLLMGHHLDDQAETMLFRLIRGAGLRGIIGMSASRPLGEGWAFRPLLAHSKDEIRQYAHTHQLEWVEDESNDDDRYDRNYLRNTIFPLLADRWPNFKQNWYRTSLWIDEADALLNEYLAEDFHACQPRAERVGESLSLAVFSALGFTRQKHLLRHWFAQRKISQPDARVLGQLDVLLTDNTEKQPALVWGEAELRRYKGRLYLLPRLAQVQSYALRWQAGVPLCLPDGASLVCAGLSTDGEDNGAKSLFEVKNREGGERCRPLGRDRSQTLKKLLQEYQLEPWLRDRVPLVYRNDELVAVGDLFVCVAEESGRGIDICWSY